MATPDDLIAAVQAGDADRVALLVALDPTLAYARDALGVSAIMLSRYRFDRAVTDALLSADPDLDIYEAVTLGFADRIEESLVEHPEGVHTFSADGFTALHLAAFFGKAEAARILLDRGASVDAYGRNDLANQPLHAAAAGRHHEVCRVLLAAGADVRASEHGGFTPLHQAAQHGDVEMTELFLSAGADPLALTADGRSAEDLAAAGGHADLAARLREVAAHGRTGA